MLHIPIPVIETERLSLRGWREGDLPAFAEFWADEDTARFVGGTCSREQAWRLMAMYVGHWVLRGYGLWALEEKASGRLAGYCGPWNPEGWPEPEIGWGLLKAFHGRGYATEAAQRARDFAYRELGWPTAVSYIAAENAASQRVAARLGAAFERAGELQKKPVGLYRHPPPGALSKQSNGNNRSN
jgi:RimJ/RimL family protein N-acetyltransferase